MSCKVASIQLSNSEVSDLTSDPFKPDFTIDAAEALVKKRVDLYLEKLRETGEAGTSLVVTVEDMPGLSIAMTYLEDPSVFYRLVDLSSAYISQKLSAIAARYSMHIVASYHCRENDAIYNCAILFGADGKTIGTYRKVHLPGSETWLVSAGDSFPVFETDIGTIGMMICYDDNWSESTGSLAINGAEIICYSTLMDPRDYRARTRAFDNCVFLIASARRNSMIVDPRGEILANAEDADEAIIYAEMELEGATLQPEHNYDTLYSGIRDLKERHVKFRRQDAYAPLVDPMPPLQRNYPPRKPATCDETTIKEVYAEHKRAMLNKEETPYHW